MSATEKYQEKFNKFYNNLDSISQYLIILIIVLIIVIICWSVIWSLSIYINNDSDRYNFKKVRSLTLYKKGKDASTFDKVSKGSILSDLSNSEYTFSIWLYIEDWYETYGKWKHIFHMGTPVRSTTKPVSLRWNTLNYQNPGVWFLPNINNIRIVISTEYVIPGSLIKEQRLEFIDLKNVDIKVWFNLSLVLNRHTLDVYYNGKLSETLVLKGTPVLNKHTIYMNYGNGFKGRIQKLEIIPKSIQPKIVNSMYQSGK